MPVIHIGHNAYTNDNRLAICYSKAAAVRELRERGIKRDIARAAVDKVVTLEGGYVTLRAKEHSDVIEVTNRTRA